MIPGLVLAGVASGQTVLYVGLALYSFGECDSVRGSGGGCDSVGGIGDCDECDSLSGR